MEKVLVFTGKSTSKTFHWKFVEGYEERLTTLTAILQPSPFVNFARDVHVILEAFKENSEKMKTDQIVYITTRPVPPYLIQQLLDRYYKDTFETSNELSAEMGQLDGFHTEPYTMTCSFTTDIIPIQFQRLLACITTLLGTLLMDIAPLCAELNVKNQDITAECAELASSLVFLQDQIVLDNDNPQQIKVTPEWNMKCTYANTRMLLIYLTSICNHLFNVTMENEEEKDEKKQENDTDTVVNPLTLRNESN